MLVMQDRHYSPSNTGADRGKDTDRDSMEDESEGERKMDDKDSE